MADGRERARFAALAALLLGGAAAAYLLLLGPSPPPPRPPPPRPPADRLVVARAEGEVRVRRGSEDSPAVLRPGDVLRAEDAVETGPDGSVQLEAGEGYRVEVEPGSRVAVKEIRAELARIHLTAGLLSAQVRGRAIEVEAGQGASARADDADLRVASSGQVASVAVSRGQARLASGGKVVTLRAGEQSRADAGGPPRDPEPIPASMLLKVEWPEERLTNRRSITIAGRADPGALVDVGGEPVAVEPDGSFRHVVRLREGAQRVTVRGRDAGGHAARVESPEIRRDTRGAPAQFDTEGLWEARGR